MSCLVPRVPVPHQRNIVRLLLVAFIVKSASAFYVPGVKAHSFGDGDKLDVQVVKLTSPKKPMLPFDYYSLAFCDGKDVAHFEIEREQENLGKILSGDVIESSPYNLTMQHNAPCKTLCKKQLSKSQVNQFAKLVREGYRVHWQLDNLPAVTKYKTMPVGSDLSMSKEDLEKDLVTRYEEGFPLGFTKDDTYTSLQAKKLSPEDNDAYLHNHVIMNILTHNDTLKTWRVVGFEVTGVSVQYENNNVEGQCQPYMEPVPLPLKTDRSQEITFTYSVLYTDSNVKWASRWDAYLLMTDSQVHWFSIINSSLILLFLTAMVALILIRALNKDFARYNARPEDLDGQDDDETGWKLVHGDVFRPPKYGSLFAVLVGTGYQVFAMALWTLFFAILGFLSPANRGRLLTALLLLFVFMGVMAGYFSARTYQMFNQNNWRKNTLLTATFYPGTNFFVFFTLNVFVWAKGSSGAVPFLNLLSLIVLWFGISVPLVYLGTYWGKHSPKIEPVTKYNRIPRQIPEQQWYMQPPFSVLVGGVLPFFAVFIEMSFIMSSLWMDRFYYMFPFLLLVMTILVITCAEVTIVMCYFQLCSEDYQWWWRSFMTSGSSGVYVFLYSIYFYAKLEVVGFVATLLFFGYMFLISFAFFVVTGTIGFTATFLFVRKIYGSIKID